MQLLLVLNGKQFPINSGSFEVSVNKFADFDAVLEVKSEVCKSDTDNMLSAAWERFSDTIKKEISLGLYDVLVGETFRDSTELGIQEYVIKHFRDSGNGAEKEIAVRLAALEVIDTVKILGENADTEVKQKKTESDTVGDDIPSKHGIQTDNMSEIYLSDAIEGDGLQQERERNNVIIAKVEKRDNASKAIKIKTKVYHKFSNLETAVKDLVVRERKVSPVFIVDAPKVFFPELNNQNFYIAETVIPQDKK